MIKPLITLALLVLAAGCTTSYVASDAYAARDIDYIDCSKCDDGNECTADTCSSEGCSHENLVCPASEKACPDGYVAACQSQCDNGCSDCEPSCAGHEMACPEIRVRCSDGSFAACQEQTENGQCAPCDPVCPCKPRFICMQWGDCFEGTHSRICYDETGCAADMKETKDCGALSKGASYSTPPTAQSGASSSSSVQFVEVMYDPSGSEPGDEYVVLEGSGDVGGWTIEDNNGAWTIPQGTVAGGKLIIARNGFAAAYGCPAHITSFNRALNNDGDQLTLKDSAGNQVDFVAWEKGASDAYPDWGASAGNGMALRKSGSWSEATPSPCS